MELEKKVIDAHAILLKALANETRLNILYSLYVHPKTWTELLFELKINPKSLRDHLIYLKKSRLVRKKRPVGFEITTAGKAVMELSLKDIVSTVEKAVEMTKKPS